MTTRTMKSTDTHELIEIFERVHTICKRTISFSVQFGGSTDATLKAIQKRSLRLDG